MTDLRSLTQDHSSFLVLDAVVSEADVSYMPKPNKVDAVISDLVAPSELNPTAFVFAFMPSGDAVMAQNTRRGLEIPGGHREGDETAEEAALREALEEIGCEVEYLRPIGMFRSRIYSGEPSGYRYPYPVSFQQFFAGVVKRKLPYTENDECLSPVILPYEEALVHMDERTAVLFAEAHRSVFGIEMSPKP